MWVVGFCAKVVWVCCFCDKKIFFFWLLTYKTQQSVSFVTMLPRVCLVLASEVARLALLVPLLHPLRGAKRTVSTRVEVAVLAVLTLLLDALVEPVALVGFTCEFLFFFDVFYVSSSDEVGRRTRCSACSSASFGSWWESVRRTARFAL